VFSIAMVVLAADHLLYQSSQILAHYAPRQHVAAARALFSSVALLFVSRIFLWMRESPRGRAQRRWHVGANRRMLYG
jgi:hypothetical protein